MRVLQVLSGKSVWPPPIWLMRQAGRYLPEYRDVRARAGDFISLCTSPALAAEVTLQPIRRFDMDAAILFSDILMLPWALGWGLRFSEGEGPRLPRWEGSADTPRLNLRQASHAVLPILETVMRVRAALDPLKALIGFAGSPFTVACYMIEGGGSKDFLRTRTLAYADTSGFGALIDTLTEATISFLGAQIEAGADVIMLFDSWAGVLSPLKFNDYVVKPTARIVSALAARFPNVPVIGFPRLSGTLIGQYARQTNVRAVGVDTVTDIRHAIEQLPSHVAVQGNLDPAALLIGGDALDIEVNNILETCRNHPLIFNLGHGILPRTPIQHVSMLMELLRSA